MKLSTTKNSAGSYTFTAHTSNGVRTWEISKEYNADTNKYEGDFWYIYETTDSKRDWYGWGLSKKSDAIKYISQILL